MSDFTVVSLFSGIGGIDLAFVNAGFKIVYANDSDQYACETYRKNFSDVRIVQCDIKDINAGDIPESDVLIAGFPCQSFSVMGYQRGFDDARGTLFFEIVRIASQIRPRVIFLENVKNLIFHDGGKTFQIIYGCLSELGYSVKYAVLDACTHGNIPQQRSRTFIAAFLDDGVMNLFAFPEEIPLENTVNDIINRHTKYNDIYYYKEDNKFFRRLKERVIDTDGIYRIDDSGVANKLYKISPTLKANMGTYPDRVPVIRDDFGIRKLTPKECLALQGFPNNFSFGNIPLGQAYKQAGNTVCVPVVERIAVNIRRALEENE